MGWRDLDGAGKAAAIIAAYPEADTAGKLAAELSRRFRERISRNAVMGVYTRDKGGVLKACPLSGVNQSQRRRQRSNAPNLPADAPHPSSGASAKRAPRVGTVSTARLKAERKPETPAPLPEPLREPIAIMDLQWWHCRYIVAGEGADARFCGGVKVRGAYCAAHGARCYGEGVLVAEAA
jgi:hypothetical protein